MEIAIVGGGWYGCHLALALKKAGHKVTLYEKNPTIFSQISGSFGIRLHAGPHYPRSAETRKNCLRNKVEFEQHYPELVVPHQYSIYGLGTLDAEGKPPKVTPVDFENVCKESVSCKIIDPKAAGYTNLTTAANIEEPSILLGHRLRSTFVKYLDQAGVEVRCNADVQSLDNTTIGIMVTEHGTQQRFDKVINTTSYQAFIPKQKDFPFDMEAVYQPCLALEYEDTKPGSRPFSFIIMDGWFPCIMPICDEQPGKKYILTHGKWTIMGSYKRPEKAYAVLGQLNDAWIEKNVKSSCESEINRFWPEFAERFRYTGWKGSVLAKLKTKCEFRSAVTYEKDNIIHVMPGKVSNVFDVEREVYALLAKKNLLQTNGYSYVQDGVLQQACGEIEEKPKPNERNTCSLQTFSELQKPNEQPANNATKIIATSFLLTGLLELAAAAAVLAFTLLALPYFNKSGIVLAAGATVLSLGCGISSIHSFFYSRREQLKLDNEKQALPLP